MTTPKPRLLGGRYEVGELIGHGGMAEVHRGFDTRLSRAVAIKLLRSDLARDQTFLARFRREAQSAAGLNHASIVAVYDSGDDHFTGADGVTRDVPYIVMEYVEGQTLRSYLADKGPLEPKEAARITEGVLEALEYSHRMGIVHRDIKPANVMIGPAGDVKVMDFGIARAVADTSATMTQTQSVVGTAQYLSPEQAQGKSVDARSDVYSTGCLLFELLTGRAPFIGDTPISVAYQHVGEPAPKPSSLQADLPESFDAVVAHALVKDREARYQSAEEFRTDLLRARLERPISAAARGSAAAAATTVIPTTPSVGVGAGDMQTEVYAAQTVAPAAAAAGAGAGAGGVDAGGNTASLPPVGHDPDEVPEKRRVGAYVLLTLAAIGVFALLGWALQTYIADQQPAEPTLVSVPRLIGLTQDQAEKSLQDAGLRGQANEVPDNATPGTVIDQTQQAGSRVAENSIVNYDVSTGPDDAAVPDVSNKSVDEATSILKESGFIVAAQTIEKNDSEYVKGKVDSTTPGAGETAKKGTTITLMVSSGKVTVPDTVGRPASEAYAMLVAAGLQPKTEQVESDEKEGSVIDQSPGSGLADRDSEVTIMVAIPKKATPTTPPPAPTETTTTTAPTTTETATN